MIHGHNGNYYIDGGIVNNFPVHLISTDKTIAINLKSRPIKNFNENFKLLDYIYDIICIPSEENLLLKNNKIPNNCTVITIELKDLDIFKFNINKKDQLDLFSTGYQKYEDITN